MSNIITDTDDLKNTELEFIKQIEVILTNIKDDNVHCYVICKNLFKFYMEKYNNNIKQIVTNLNNLGESSTLHNFYKTLNSMFIFYIGFIIAKTRNNKEKKKIFAHKIKEKWEYSLSIVNLI